MYPNRGGGLSSQFYQQPNRANEAPPLPPRYASSGAADTPPPLPPRSPYMALTTPQPSQIVFPPVSSYNGPHSSLQDQGYVDSRTPILSHLSPTQHVTNSPHSAPQVSPTVHPTYQWPPLPPSVATNALSSIQYRPMTYPMPLPHSPGEQVFSLHHDRASAAISPSHINQQPAPTRMVHTVDWDASVPHPSRYSYGIQVQRCAPQDFIPPSDSSQISDQSKHHQFSTQTHNQESFELPVEPRRQPPDLLDVNQVSQQQAELYPRPLQAGITQAHPQTTSSLVPNLNKTHPISPLTPQGEDLSPIISTSTINDLLEELSISHGSRQQSSNISSANFNPPPVQHQYSHFPDLRSTLHQQDVQITPEQLPTDAKTTQNYASSPYVSNYDPPLDVVIRVEDLAPPLQGSSEHLRQCPYPDPNTPAYLWYFYGDAPNFFACSNCFHKDIATTNFKTHFELATNTSAFRIYCHFAAPRSKQLWAQAVAANNFSLVERFMKHRMTLQPCRGLEGAKGTDKVAWYSMKGDEIPGFVVCTACYEDIILATNFPTKFGPCKLTQSDGDTWVCDMALKSLPQAIEEHSEKNDWQGFVTSTRYRLTLPKCAPYQLVPSESRKWYQPKAHLPDYVICETCYLDCIASSSMAANFEKRPDYLVRQRSEWICTMGYIGMTIAWTEAKQWNNYRLWFENARILMANPICDGKPVVLPKWYTLKNGFNNFDLCPSCYSCLIATFGFGIHFKETTYPAEEQRACDFFPARYRFMKYMDKLSEAVFTNNFDVLQDEITATVHIPGPCPRSNAAAGRGDWWGMDEFLICGECHLEVVKGTPFEFRLKYANATSAKARRCDLYSPRMRRLWAEALEKDDLEGFAKLASERNEMYHRTIVQCQQLLSEQRLALSRQQYLNAQSSFYNSLNLSSTTSTGINFTGITQPKYTYGAVDVGYGFASQWGVDGARLGKQAHDVMVGTMGYPAKIAMLENIWKELE